MAEYKMVRLGDVCEIQSGGTPSRSKTEYWKDGTIPWVKIGDFSGKYLDKTTEHITQQGLDNSSAKLFSKGTILYSIFATLGEATILNIDATTNQAIAGIKIKDKSSVDIDYFYSFLKSLKDEVNRIGRGVAQNNINLSILKSFFIPLPPLETQKQIAAQLDKCTAVIAKHKQMLENYDTLIKSRFIEMFGDIIQNTKNWELKSFTEIAKSRLGKMLDSKKQTGKEKYPYLANFNVQWFRFNLENLNEMDFSEADRIEFALKDGDLLVCEGGEVGRCAVWHNQIENCFFQKAVHRVRLNMDLVHPDYMAYWFKFRSDFNSFDDIVGSKATIAHLTGEKLKLLQIPVPPLSLQNDFASFVQQIDKSKFEYNIEEIAA